MGKRPSQAKGTTPTRHGGGNRQTSRTPPAPAPPARSDTSRPWGPIPYILIVWFVSRIILTGVGVLARSWIGQVVGISNVQLTYGIGTGHAWLDIWSAWDSRWYYSIMDMGYLAAAGATTSYSAWAFFPLYPWVARAVGTVVGDLYVAALIVSNAALLVGAWFLYQLVAQYRDDATARKAVLFLFLFPTAYVFSCLMTESLFLALTVGAWYYGTRGNWLLAGVLGMGSAMTRLVGLFMAPLLALEYLRQRQWRLARLHPDALWIGLVPVGLGIFMAVCYTLTGNSLQFVWAQSGWAPSDVGMNPLRVLWRSLDKAWHGTFWGQVGGYLGLGYGALATIVVTGILLWGRKRIGTLLMLWSVGLILISLSSHSNSTQSMPRYLAVIFPVSMILASMRARSAAFALTVLTLMLLQAATFALWTAGWRVAI